EIEELDSGEGRLNATTLCSKGGFSACQCTVINPVTPESLRRFFRRTARTSRSTAIAAPTATLKVTQHSPISRSASTIPLRPSPHGPPALQVEKIRSSSTKDASNRVRTTKTQNANTNQEQLRSTQRTNKKRRYFGKTVAGGFTEMSGIGHKIRRVGKREQP